MRVDQTVEVEVFEVSDGLADYPRAMNAVQVFDWYARHAPDRPALIEGDGYISFGELDAIACQLARRLMRHGVDAGDVVATLTNRSSETVVAWLAILKAGGAYLPLDTALPDDALQFILADAEPVLTIGEKGLLAQRVLGRERKCLALEEELDLAELEQPTLPVAETAATDPAYIMYTSGSTGRPKGVIVPHRGIVRLVRAQNYMEFGPDEVFLLISSLAFDVSTWEVWGALLNGARLVIVPGERLSIDQIRSSIADYGVTSVYLTSALFNVVVDVDPTALKGVHQILVGGDVMSPEHSARLGDVHPDATLINAYGPTETTTFHVCHRLPKGKWPGGAIPIGTPIAHSTAYILDDHLQPVADGEMGQLCLAGDGVGIGYLNRPELTAERFRPDPFVEGGMMYLTGDLARIRPDGVFEFFGRKDRQVKIDGKRVELDEIEHALRRDDAIDDASVMLRQFEAVEKRIVAFLRVDNAACAPADFIEGAIARLRKRVPDYMVPGEIHVVDAFPLTPNGKVDRAALLSSKTPDGQAQ